MLNCLNWFNILLGTFLADLVTIGLGACLGMSLTRLVLCNRVFYLKIDLLNFFFFLARYYTAINGGV